MGWLLKLLGGSFGPYLVGGAAALLLLAGGAAGVQTLRLHHAKSDLATARDALTAAKADLQRCHDNTAALQASITAQNAQLQAKADEDAKTLASATKALAQAQQGRSSAEARAAKLLSQPAAGADACARAIAARKQVLEALQ